MRRRIVRLATTVLVSGGLGLAGLGLAAGTAQAAPGFAPQATWCPGDPPKVGATWDPTVCHDYHYEVINGTTQLVEGPPPVRMCGPVPCALFP